MNQTGTVHDVSYPEVPYLRAVKPAQSAADLSASAPSGPDLPGPDLPGPDLPGPDLLGTGRRLAHLGLDAETERAYLVVLRRPSWSLAELADRLGSDVTGVRQVVRRLTELGLVARGESPEVIRPLNPRLSLTALLAEREADLARVTRDLERGRVAAAEIAGEYARRHPAPLVEGNASVESAGSPAAAQRTLAGLLRSATSEVLVSTPSTTAVSDPIAGLRELGVDRLAPPVRYRVLVPDAARTHPVLSRRLAQLSRNGAQVRTAPSVPFCSLIVDTATAAMPGDRAGRGGVSVLRLATAVEALTELFERVWQTATPLRQPTGLGDASGLSVREREVLTLLGDGGTDASAAAQLGVSVRTVRRMVSDMMARMGAQSRFQAGVKAAERGWVGSGPAMDPGPFALSTASAGGDR